MSTPSSGLDGLATRLDRMESPPPIVVVVWTSLVVAAVADVATTLYGLHVGLGEWNPIARGLLFEYGIPAKVALKVTVVGYATIAFVAVSRLGYRRAAVSMVGVVAFVWFVASGWNVLVILRVIG